jgi:hypothetical protein
MSEAGEKLFVLHGIAKAPPRALLCPMLFDGATTGTLKCDAFFAIYSAVPQETAILFENAEAVRKISLAHHDILVAFAEVTDVVPVTLGSSFQSLDALRAAVQANAPHFIDSLMEIEGSSEFLVKLKSAASEKEDVLPSDSGRSYLAALSRRKDAGKAKLDARSIWQQRLRSSIAARSKGMVQKPQQGAVIFECACLIQRQDAQDFIDEWVREQDSLKRAGLSITIDGPWPPYSFVMRPE